MALALERALGRFGAHLHFDGDQAGARTLIDIVVTHDLQVTFTDDRLNAQIQTKKSPERFGPGPGGLHRSDTVRARKISLERWG